MTITKIKYKFSFHCFSNVSGRKLLHGTHNAAFTKGIHHLI